MEELKKSYDEFNPVKVKERYCDYYWVDTFGDSKSSYSIDDMYLVHTTGFLPTNKVIQTYKSVGAINYALIFYINEFIADYVSNFVTDEVARSYILNNITIPYKVQRDTVHFTINGLVGNHAYGSFNGKYIIIDSLNKHIDDPSLLNARVEDTFFQGDFRLSDKAHILISNADYLSLEKDSIEMKELEKYTLHIYEGSDRNVAVANVLNSLKADCFLVNSNGYSNSDIQGPANIFLQSFRRIIEFANSKRDEKYKITAERHCYHDSYYKTKNDEYELIKEGSLSKIYEILKASSLNDELCEKIYSSTKKYDRIPSYYIEYIYDALEEIGVDKLFQIITGRDLPVEYQTRSGR